MGFWDGSGISSTIICKQSAHCFRQITTPTPHHSIFTGRMLFLTPNQQCQSTEGNCELLCHPRRGRIGGVLSDNAICPSVPGRSCRRRAASLGYKHAGCLQLSQRRPPEMCRLQTRPRTDVDPLRVELPAAGAYRLAAPGAITC